MKISVLIKDETLRKNVLAALLEKGLEGIGYATEEDLILGEKEGATTALLDLERISAQALKDLPQVQWISSFSAGVEDYDHEALAKKNIQLTNASGVHGKNIAEQVLGGMIHFSRNFSKAMANQQEKRWQNYKVSELSEKELLIIGAGNIGQEVARKAKAFDMKVTGARRSNGDSLDYFDELITLDELENYLPKADYVVLIIPYTKENHHFMKEERFCRMKASAIFINVGRGATVDERALVRALENETIGGAFLDVFEEEPLPESSPLWTLDNVLITPHNAGLTPNYVPRLVELFAENVKRFKGGEALQQKVDLKRGY